MNPLFQEFLSAIFRWAFTLVGGMLVTQGIITTDQSERFVGGAVLAGIGLVWALYKRYHDKLVLNTARSMPANTSVDELRQRVNGMPSDVRREMALKVAVICISLGMMTACASTPIHQATVASTGLYSALATIDDAERALYNGGAPCTQPAPCLTKEQHDQLGPKILIALKAGRAANSAVIVAGNVPQELKDTVNAVADLSKEVTSLLPDGAAKSKLQTAIIGAQTAINVLLAFNVIKTGAMNGSEHNPRLGPTRADPRADRVDGDRTPEEGPGVPRYRGRPGAARETAGALRRAYLSA